MRREQNTARTSPRGLRPAVSRAPLMGLALVATLPLVNTVADFR